jgi:Protein of unknown function DUF104
MTLTFDAVVENGALKLAQPVALPDGTTVRLSVDVVPQARPTPHGIAGTDQPEAGAELGPDPMEDVFGIGDGPEDGAANHDYYIYGKRRGRRP